jgi:FixJ family two-component response regulator
VSTSQASLVAVVDDDEGMRRAMRRVLETEGYVTEIYETAEDFLASGAATRARCLVLDVRLPGMSGIDLHLHLRSAGNAIPAVFVTAHYDPRPRTTAVHAAGWCLVKPFAAETLIQAIRESIHEEGSHA